MLVPGLPEQHVASRAGLLRSGLARFKNDRKNEALTQVQVAAWSSLQ
jgi:hypothetical protein